MLIISNKNIYYKEWSTELRKSVISEINPRGVIGHLWDQTKLAQTSLWKELLKLSHGIIYIGKRYY